MRCPKCGANNDKVIESRASNDNSSIRRRRECLVCHQRYTSYERIEEKQIRVVKNDQRREIFQRDKLENSVRISIIKRKISEEEMENLLDTICQEIKNTAGTLQEITSKEIGNIVLKNLYKTDMVAYIRFASVYKKFDDIDQFIKEIANVSKS